jgi:DnaK suppressor protein
LNTLTVRQRLEQARDELDASINVLRGDDAGERNGEFPHDQADAGTTLSEKDRTEAMLDSALTQRTEVVDAIQRVQEGSYGSCVDCGKPIPDGRLEARPEASRCVGCQSRWDQTRR